MKTALTLALTAFFAAPVLAHSGHDHSSTLGGEAHHVYWFVVPVIVALGFVAYRALRQR